MPIAPSEPDMVLVFILSIVLLLELCLALVGYSFIKFVSKGKRQIFAQANEKIIVSYILPTYFKEIRWLFLRKR